MRLLRDRRGRSNHASRLFSSVQELTGALILHWTPTKSAIHLGRPASEKRWKNSYLRSLSCKYEFETKAREQGYALAQAGIPHGDAISVTIAAASILAKVERNAMVAARSAQYPQFSLGSHYGYGTAAHTKELETTGRRAAPPEELRARAPASESGIGP